jgi:hypothetical protein
MGSACSDERELKVMKKNVAWASVFIVCVYLIISCSGDNNTDDNDIASLTVNVEDQIYSVTLYDGKLEDGEIIAAILAKSGGDSRLISMPAGHVCTILTNKAPTGTLYSSSATVDKTMSVTIKNDYSIRWANPTDRKRPNVPAEGEEM